jgi:phosphoglycolate phosphatase-like HAD superfamily hydrolase
VRLFLFDVDGTLVTVRGAGRRALERAMVRVYGCPVSSEGHDFRGRTDLSIALDILGAAGLSEAAIRDRLDACFAVYAEELDAIIGEGAAVQVMPGVAELVRALSARDDAVVGLLTGNVEAGARIKLRRTGLWPLFRVGAFGDDDADRRRLPAIACERARALVGREFAYPEVTIIGDTPLDVDCARASGAVAVAVATGFHAGDELEACAPDLFFKDFADVDAAVRALTSP